MGVILSFGHSTESSAAAAVERLSDPDPDGAISMLFTAQRTTAPAVWAPVFGSPRPLPLFPDGKGRWRREVRLPQEANASWALIPDVRGMRLSPWQRLRALASYEARDALATRMDAAFLAPDPAAPSLYRLIGSDSRTALAPNIGIIPTPGSFAASTLSSLALPAPEGDGQLTGDHRLIQMEDRGPHGSALFFDGEVLRRFDAEIATTGWSRAYLDNRSAVSRLRAHARPRILARSLSSLRERLHERPQVVVGVSAAAPTALALALLLQAPQAILLSPAFPTPTVRQQLAADAAAAGIVVDVHAGSEENGGGDARRSIRGNAGAFVMEMNRADGAAILSEFVGGHDLAAWHPVLLHALRAAANRHLRPPEEGKTP